MCIQPSTTHDANHLTVISDAIVPIAVTTISQERVAVPLIFRRPVMNNK